MTLYSLRRLREDNYNICIFPNFNKLLLKGSGNFVLDSEKRILDLAHATMIIMNLWVSQEPHDFYKPIALSDYQDIYDRKYEF